MELSELKYRQALPLEDKIELTKERITEWYEYWEGKVYVSFSGGKDSTVLLHLVRSIYPEIPAVFVNTGLEYPEILKFVKTIDNVTTLRPKRKFKDVIDKYGYPVISKEVSKCILEIRTTTSKVLLNKRLYGDDRGNGKLPEKWKSLVQAPFKISDQCCYHLKKAPINAYNNKTKQQPFIGISFSDSFVRKRLYMKYGCNAFTKKKPASTPIAFWSEKDIWQYITKHNLPYSTIYDKGYDNTGCMFCMFGVQYEKDINRFQRMKIQHPKHYDYCINRLGCGKVLDFINVPY